jgi:hypothetical protein
MEIVFDLWHLAFANLVKERAPPSFIVESEVRLSIEPQRADLLLIRRADTPRDDGAGRVLHAIWPLLAKVTLVEFKSPTRSSFRKGDLIRLWSYGGLYQSTHIDEVPRHDDVTLLLVIASITPNLSDEIDAMGWKLADLGGGYRRIDGTTYPLYVAVTDEVSEIEHDGFLRLFSHLKDTEPEAKQWVRHWMKETKMSQKIEEMPGYDDIYDKLVADRPLEKLLAKYSPEQRLAGLSPEQQLLAVSDEILRQLPDSYLRTLSPEAQSAIKARIGRPD